MNKSLTQPFFKSIFTAVIFSVVFFTALSFLHILIIELFSLQTSIAKMVNQFVKALSLFGACILCLGKNKGFIKGALTGVGFAIALLIFTACFTGNISFLAVVFEVIFSFIIGALGGIIAVNFKK